MLEVVNRVPLSTVRQPIKLSRINDCQLNGLIVFEVSSGLGSNREKYSIALTMVLI